MGLNDQHEGTILRKKVDENSEGVHVVGKRGFKHAWGLMPVTLEMKLLTEGMHVAPPTKTTLETRRGAGANLSAFSGAC